MNQDTLLGTIQNGTWKASLWRQQGWIVEHPDEFMAKILARSLNAFFPANARPIDQLGKMNSRDPVGWALRHAAKHYDATVERQ